MIVNLHVTVFDNNFCLSLGVVVNNFYRSKRKDTQANSLALVNKLNADFSWDQTDKVIPVYENWTKDSILPFFYKQFEKVMMDS